MLCKALFAILAGICIAGTAMAVSLKYQSAVKARINGDYAVVQFADGSKSLVPLSSLDSSDRAWIVRLSSQNPMAAGKAKVVVVKAEDLVKAKKTIEVSKTEGPLETVQLCPPNVFRNQIGGTCMMYARVHWLDIAGYYVDDGSIYRVINVVSPDNPWSDPRYLQGMENIFLSFKSRPVLHRLPAQAEDPFEWAREELRKGHPILAAFPREIWQALPPGFVAAHPWNGGPVGHQIVINGFTWNSRTRKGTFHIINSWQELPQFDLTTDAAGGGALVIEQSLSPIGEAKVQVAKEVVQHVTFLKSVGDTGETKLYEVQTNLGTRRIVAPNEAAVREMVENEQ
ncbi:MAG TPA: hypothetical protein VFB27_04040 [Opitutaceae bacterium]|nr:hypothetical protein [Opitutaceae bacterium]